MRALVLPLFLAACTSPDGAEKDPVDADGDSYFDAADGNGDDCDDTNPDINPGATEVCGGGDEDCDGLVDDADDDIDAASVSLWYPDADADTFGGTAGETAACIAPDGYLAAGGDCDDTRADVNPSGIEICDEAGADEDCDGLANDDDAGVLGQSTWYADADADTYGALDGVEACYAAEGQVATTGDCDDTRADVFPGAIEVCDPLDTDEDCSGAADDADPAVTGQLPYYPDLDGDGWGDETASVRCDALPGETTNAGDCDDDDPAMNGDDRDGDGESPCDGDCDDADPEVTADECAYTSMVGTFDIPGLPCEFDMAGTALSAPLSCPDCEFAFDTTGTLLSGTCISSFTAELGWDEELSELSFSLWATSTYAGSEIGPFAGTLTPGYGYDTLEWSGYSAYYYLYEGTMFLYR